MDSSLEESGFEPLVPLTTPTFRTSRLKRNLLRSGGDPNPLPSREESSANFPEPTFIGPRSPPGYRDGLVNEQGGGIGLELGDLFSCATCCRGHARIVIRY
jgi:hypothetical protein